MRVLCLLLFLFFSCASVVARDANIPLPVRKPAIDAEPGKTIELPDKWTDEEIANAQKLCSKLLSKIALTFEPIDPIKNGKCGTPAPIKLKSIDLEPKISIQPDALLNCRMAARLNKWLTDVVQPAAKKLLHARIVKIRNIASYSCRHRYNNPKKRISEHAFANALDIAGFETAKEEVVSVLDYWGLTRWEIAAWKKAKEEAEAKAKAEAEAKAKAEAEAKAKAEAEAKAKSEADAKAKAEADAKQKRGTTSNDKNEKKSKSDGADQSSSEQNVKSKTRRKKELLKKVSTQTTRRSRQKSRKSADSKKAAAEKPVFPATLVTIKKPPDVPKDDPRRVFLRRIHTGACGIFGTVLGPEANGAHKNHFHLDLAPRKRSAYCE